VLNPVTGACEIAPTGSGESNDSEDQ
jgi:hypothetical protein